MFSWIFHQKNIGIKAGNVFTEIQSIYIAVVEVGLKNFLPPYDNVFLVLRDVSKISELKLFREDALWKFEGFMQVTTESSIQVDILKRK